MTKDVIAAILERRCVRKFKGDKVLMATIGRIIDAGRWAPSAGNLQPWQFIVVYNETKKLELAAAANNQKHLAEAPVVIVVCVDPEVTAAKYSERGRDLYVLQDSGAAVQNMLLAAEGYGLASCWVGSFVESQVSKILDLPKGLVPVTMIPIGFADEEAEPPARRPVEEIVTVVD